MTTSMNKPPFWFWIVSVLALIWNGLGVMAYLTRAFATDEMIAALPKEAQAEYLAEYPAWYTAAFATAVFFGAIGSIALLIRKKWAHSLFVISAIGAIVQHIYIFINVEMSSAQLIMPILVIVVCLYLIWFSKRATVKGWLH
ncbi:MAG: hypothetical protein HKN40_02350 [Winogradskyella sp.]|uniref:hypothetical protein n=1 Tax=Winogradskyella sp. TaxID=1883156 RepID=UPI001790278B|nr:hypothetical protein [Winogradskyella sp.]